MSFWDEKEAKRMFQKLPFYITFIGIPCIKHLKNMDLLHKLPFYDELSIKQASKVFKRYARSYKIEIIKSKDPSAQLEASKLGIKDLFKELLDEIKGFKYQITVKVLLGKHKGNGDIEFALISFNSTIKTKISLNICLMNLFKKFVTELIIGLIKNLVE